MRACFAPVWLAGFVLAMGCSAGDVDPPNNGLPPGVGGATGGTAGKSGGPGGASQGGQSGQGGAAAGGSGTSGQAGDTSAGGAGAGEAGAGPGGSDSGVGGMSGGGTGGAGGGTPSGLCATTLTVALPDGATNPRVAGEWNGFDLATAVPVTPDGAGHGTATVGLAPGLVGYKVIYEQGGQTVWALDAAQGRRKYLDGIENSAVKVADCALPSMVVKATKSERPAAGQGTFTATLGYVDGTDGTGPDATKFEVTSGYGDTSVVVPASQVKVAASGEVTLTLTGLGDGKHRVTVVPVSKSGKKGEPVRLPFWVEASAFDWNGALVYMVMTDRYVDGDKSNNGSATPNSFPAGDFKGGDLEGLRQRIADGTLDQLGVRAIWLTPFQTNPSVAYPAADGSHMVTGYHGYWPTKGREVAPRLGGSAGLHAVVEEAHKHGIRILQDYVLNHVHEEHEYYKAHPEWFRTGCVCGTDGCDWTAKALECMFAPYMPDVNHTVPAATAQLVSDAVYWLDEYDIDGLRVDAVKHVEEVATRNLAAEVRETFEKAGTRAFMMGETAMGWNECDDPCNDDNYGTISRYIGPQGLDGQFDFVLYHAVSYNSFAYQSKGLLHADYWVKHGLEKWPAGAIMTPYIGSHDTARFVTLADPSNQSKQGNQWDNIAQAPADNTGRDRLRVAMAWLLGLPGAPLMYYGDEYGQWGGVDPNNRAMWRPEAQLGDDQKSVLAFVRKLGQARKNVPAMRVGSYVSAADLTLGTTLEDAMIFGRKSDGSGAIVGINRSNAAIGLVARAQEKLGLAAGTVLKDALGGPGATVSSAGQVSVTVPAHGAVVLAPLPQGTFRASFSLMATAPHPESSGDATHTATPPLGTGRAGEVPAGLGETTDLQAPIGMRFGRGYQVVRLLGEGGMGAVYEAITPEGGRVALKLVAANHNDEAMRRFAREARTMQAIDHPHVVRVLDTGTDELQKLPFLVMELLDGRDLGAVVHDVGPLDPALAARLFAQAASGLGAIHASGVTHRDIKTSNLFLHRHEGRLVVKVCDFGIAKKTDSDSDSSTSGELTGTGGIIGSPQYMSPEQVQDSKHVDARSDLWSLSVAMYEALCGHKAWSGCASVGELLVAVCTRDLPSLQQEAPWLPAGMAAVVHRSLHRPLAERFASAEALAEALAPFAAPAESLTDHGRLALAAELRRQHPVVASIPPAAAVPQVPAVDPSRSSLRPTTTTEDVRGRPSRLVIGVGALLALALVVGFGARVMRPASDTTGAATQVTVKATSPLLPRRLRGSLQVMPSTASVRVRGVPQRVVDGRVALEGIPGEDIDVRVEASGVEVRRTVTVTSRGQVIPEQIEVEAASAASAAPVGTAGSAAPTSSAAGSAATPRETTTRTARPVAPTGPTSAPAEGGLKLEKEWK